MEDSINHIFTQITAFDLYIIILIIILKLSIGTQRRTKNMC